MKMNQCRKAVLLLAILAAVALVQTVQAAPFNFQSRDLMLCFRKIGANGGTVGAYDFEVNVGQASNYVSVAAGTVVTNTQLTAAQLAAVFDNLNDMNWSVGGLVARSDGDATYPFYTIWTTAPRGTPDTMATPWIRASQASQANPANKITAIENGARLYSGSQPSDPLFNTATAVRVPAGNGQDYGTFVGANGDYSGTFQGNVENTTASDFTSGGSVSRSDLYELMPSSSGGEGIYLGYFELRPNGAVVFVRAGGTPPPPPPPPVLSIARAATTSTISFLTTNGATYSLRFTNSAGLSSPISAWSLSPNTAPGDGTIKSISDTSTDSDRVYAVEAH